MTPKCADLFSGIGGMSLAARRAGFEPVFAAEIDRRAADTFAANHGLRPAGDIAGVDPGSVPDHDLALVGLPCVAFSALGLRRGFADPAEHVWYPALRVVARKQPSVVVIENTANLLHHDRGRSLQFLVNTLRLLGYRSTWQILDAADFGSAQVRRRLFVVASRGRRFDFGTLPPPDRTGRIVDILDADSGGGYLDPGEYVLFDRPTASRSGLRFAGYRRGSLWRPGGRLDHSRTHRHMLRIYGAEGLAPTLTAQGAARRMWVRTGSGVRSLTTPEWVRLMGFPPDWRWPHPEQTCDQLGNSVHVPTVTALLTAVRHQLPALVRRPTLV